MADFDVGKVRALRDDLVILSQRTAHLHMWLTLEKSLHRLADNFKSFILAVEKAANTGNDANWDNLKNWWNGCRNNDLVEVEVNSSIDPKIGDNGQDLSIAPAFTHIKELIRQADSIQEAIDGNTMAQLPGLSSEFSRKLRAGIISVQNSVDNEIALLKSLSIGNKKELTSEIYQFLDDVNQRHHTMQQKVMLANHVRELRNAVSECDRIVRESLQPGGFERGPFDFQWKSVREKLLKLTAFIEANNDIHHENWQSALKQHFEATSTELDFNNLGNVDQGVRDLNEQVVMIEAQIYLDLDTFISTLVSLTDKAIG